MENIKFIMSYRNYDIFYNIETEKFYSEYTPEKDKLHLVKKSIDEYIKENYNFKPFRVIKVDEYLSNFSRTFNKVVEITGIRKDGGFQTSDGLISNSELESKYNDTFESAYYLVIEEKFDEINSFVVENYNKIKSLEENITFLKKQNKEKVKELLGEKLLIYRNKLINNE